MIRTEFSRLRRCRVPAGLMLVSALVVVAVAVIAVTRAPLPNSPPPTVDPDVAFADIKWAELIPAGATILKTRGAMPPAGENLTDHRIWLGSNQSADEITAFYEALLNDRRGWEPDGSLEGIASTAESDACTWHNREVTVRIGLQDMGGWRELNAPDRGWRTIYSIRVIKGASTAVMALPCLSDQ